MTKSDPLLTLIHTLSATEKRYVKLFAQQHAPKSTSVNLTLFNLVVKHYITTDKALQEKVADYHFAKHLSATKNKLRSLILKALRNFYAEATTASKLRHLLENIELLFHKGLYKQCRLEINRATKLATPSQHHTTMLELHRWNERLLNLENDKTLSEQFEMHKQEGDQLITQLTQQHQIRHAYYSMRVASSRTPRARTPEAQQQIDAVLELLPPANEVKDTLSQIYAVNTNALHSFVSGNFKAAQQQYHKALQLFADQKDLRHEASDLYRNTLGNYMNSCLMSEEFNTYYTTLQQAKKLTTNSPEAHRRLQAVLLYHQMNFSLNFGTLQEGEKAIEEIDHYLNTYNDAIPASQRVSFTYNSAVLLFFHDCGEAASQKVNQLHQLGKGEMRQDIRRFAHILELILLFDRGKSDLLEYTHRATIRQYKLSDTLLWYETAVLQFLKKWHADKANDPKAYRAAAAQLKTHLEQQQQATEGRQPTGLQEVLHWLASKANGQSLATYYEGVLEENRKKLQRGK